MELLPKDPIVSVSPTSYRNIVKLHGFVEGGFGLGFGVDFDVVFGGAVEDFNVVVDCKVDL